MLNEKWTVDEYEELFNNFSTEGYTPSESIANRAPLTITNKAASLGIKPHETLTSEGKEFVDAHEKVLGKAICIFLGGHSPNEFRDNRLF